MKRWIGIALVLSFAMASLWGCAYFAPVGSDSAMEEQAAEEQKSQERAGRYADGVYRGFYKYGDREELAVQFELRDDIFVSVTFRSLKYKDGDYLARDATSIQKQVAQQYRQAGNYLEGKEISAVGMLMDAENVVEDQAAVTGATLNTDKLKQAVEDGLQRNVFKPADWSAVTFPDEYLDGRYRGSYHDGGVEQIAVEVEIRNDRFESVTYQKLNYGDRNYLEEDTEAVVREIAGQYLEAAEYLEGKKVQALSRLYEPPQVIEDRDAVTGATLCTNKLISAVCKALAEGPVEE